VCPADPLRRVAIGYYLLRRVAAGAASLTRRVMPTTPNPADGDPVVALFGKLSISFLFQMKMLEQEIGHEEMIRHANNTLVMLFSTLTDAYEAVGGDGPALVKKFVESDKQFRIDYPEVEQDKAEAKEHAQKIIEALQAVTAKDDLDPDERARRSEWEV